MKLLQLLPVVLLALISFPSHAQNSNSNFVVIGAFRVLDNAVRFTAAANKSGFTAQYAIHPARQWYYVYVLDTDDKKKAYNLLIKIKVETDYKDAWVFTGILGTEQIAARPSVVTEPVKEQPVVEVVKEPVKEPVVEMPITKDNIQTPKIDSTLIKPEPEVKNTKGKPFYFKVVSKTDGKELFGNLQLQEAVGASQYQAIKSGEIVYLEAPRNKRGSYNIIAQLPGYKQSNLIFVYDNPAIAKGSQNEGVITLTLD